MKNVKKAQRCGEPEARNTKGSASSHNPLGPAHDIRPYVSRHRSPLKWVAKHKIKEIIDESWLMVRFPDNCGPAAQAPGQIYNLR